MYCACSQDSAVSVLDWDTTNKSNKYMVDNPFLVRTPSTNIIDMQGCRSVSSSFSELSLYLLLEGFLVELLTKNYRKNWSGASAGPNTKKEMELSGTNVKKK